MLNHLFDLLNLVFQTLNKQSEYKIIQEQYHEGKIDGVELKKILLEVLESLSYEQKQEILDFVEWPLIQKTVKEDTAKTIHSPMEMPDPTFISQTMEPWIKLEIITPEEYLGKIIELITERRGSFEGISTLSMGQIRVTGELPLSEMILDFYDDLKSSSKGYATMSYEVLGFRAGSLVKLDFLVNTKPVGPLAVIVEKNSAELKGRQICEKLKELIPRQQIEIAIQAAIGSRIIARETIKPFRKDVTAKLYGGDITRRMKLLDKQKAGKKRMKTFGNVEIPQSAFLNVLKK